MQTVIRIALLTTGVYFVSRYRYRIINTLINNRLLRSLAVSSVMNLPFIRRKMMEQMFK